MKLSQVTIRNFRGIRELTVNLKGYTTLIGPNNAGKSSILRAITLLCNNQTPSIEEFRNQNIREKIEIDGVFEDLQDWERAKPGISGIICDDKIQLRLSAQVIDKSGKESVSKEYFYKTRKDVITGFSEEWEGISSEIKTIAEGLEIKNKTNFKKKKTELINSIKENHPSLLTSSELEWSNESISISAALQQGLPNVIVIPAVHDASDETKISKTGKSALNELLTALILPRIKRSNEYRAIETSIEALKSKLVIADEIPKIKEINDGITKGLKRIVDAESQIRFGQPDIESALVSSVELRIIDGEVNTPIHLQGHGLQRSLIFSLLETTAELDRKRSEVEREIDQETNVPSIDGDEAVLPEFDQRSLILLFEEPELYIHPHLLRKLKDSLTKLVEGGLWQVVCTTHSPAFVEITHDPTSLAILRKNSTTKEVEITQLLESPFDETEDGLFNKQSLRAALDFNPTLNEVFFANESVLVEGDTELALLKHCKKLLTKVGVDPNLIHDTTIVSCSGKWTIPAIAKLLSAFSIPFKVIHDRDLKGTDNNEIENLHRLHPYRANEKISSIVPSERILVIDDTLEDVLGINSLKPKPLRAIMKVAEILEGNKLSEYPKLEEFAKFAYSLND